MQQRSFNERTEEIVTHRLTKRLVCAIAASKRNQVNEARMSEITDEMVNKADSFLSRCGHRIPDETIRLALAAALSAAPGEWYYERRDELSAEQDRRAALAAQGDDAQEERNND